MAAPSIAPLTKLQDRYSARGDLLSAVLSHVAEDPDFGDELAQALIEAGCGSATSVAAAKSGGGTHADQVMAYFRERSNEWAEVAQIRKATGIGRGAIANILYKTHVKQFEHRPHPNHKSRKIWRLAPQDEKQRLLTPIVGLEVTDD